MRIELKNGFHLSPPVETDIPAFVQHLNDPYIYARTLMLPADYSEKDARFFLTLCNTHESNFGHPIHFSIRNPEGKTIGGCGFHGKNSIPGLAHRDEIGYWLATAYRKQGIMTQAVAAIVDYGFQIRGLLRIDAPVYSFNTESAAVLVRCGFKLEGEMKKAYFRNGEYVDALHYAIVK
jgi:ribosomal-protein-alanine N-acetyltransferase